VQRLGSLSHVTSRPSANLEEPMSEDKISGPTPEPTSQPEGGEDAITGSIGLSEGYRGINVVNLAPVSGVPDPGGLPSADTAPSGGGGESVAQVATPPADSAPPPRSTQE
jgi:hypothetical protein